VEWLQERNAWPGLKSVIKVESRREIGEKIETETRFYLASAVLTAILAAAFVRGHWGIENSLLWVLDMVMRDDESRVRTGNAAENLAIIKHIAYNLIRRGKGKHSFRSKRKLAAWDEDYLLSLLVA
jgi:predicted transposase YbfD/YdcC